MSQTPLTRPKHVPNQALYDRESIVQPFQRREYPCYAFSHLQTPRGLPPPLCCYSDILPINTASAGFSEWIRRKSTATLSRHGMRSSISTYHIIKMGWDGVPLAAGIVRLREAGRRKSASSPMGKSAKHILATGARDRTHRPDSGDRSHNATGYQHGPQPPGALEQHAAQAAGCYRVRRVVLAPQVADIRIEAVVCDRDHAGRVPQERSSPGDGVQDRVEPQLRRLAGRSPQALLQAPGST